MNLKPIFSLKLALALLLACRSLPIAALAETVTHNVTIEEAASERSGLRKAMRKAVERSVYDLKLETDDRLFDRVLDEYQLFIVERVIRDIIPVGELFDYDIEVKVDAWKLEQYIREKSGNTVEAAAELAGNPGIVIAVAPRMNAGVQTGQDKLLRTQITERLNTLLVAKLKDAGFRSVLSRDWVEREVDYLITATTGIEINADGEFSQDSARAFNANIKYKSQQDLWVDFSITGIVDVDIVPVAANYEVTLYLNGAIHDSHSVLSKDTEPVFGRTTVRAGSVDKAIDAALVDLADRVFEKRLFDGMLASWQLQMDQGRAYAFGLFYDDDDFRKKVRKLLQANGTIIGSEDIDSYRQMLYVVPDNLTRQQMKDVDSFLESAEGSDDVAVDDFFIRGKNGQFYIAEKDSRHEKTIELGLTSSPDLLVAYELLKFGVKSTPAQPVVEPQPGRAVPPPVTNDASMPLELKMQQIALSARSALGLAVGFSDRSQSTGTAWAVSENIWVTNAHVAEGVQNNGTEGKFIMPNRGIGGPLKIKRMVIHPDYKMDGADVAIIFTESANAPQYSYLSMAEINTIYALDQGEPLLTLGYPSGNLANRGFNIKAPEAIMQTGISVAVTDQDYVHGEPAKNQLVRYNMFSAQGASGSPIFNSNGEVVAIVYAVNAVSKVQRNVAGQSRDALVVVDGQNFAWRADVVRDLLEQHAPEVLR